MKRLATRRGTRSRLRRRPHGRVAAFGDGDVGRRGQVARVALAPSSAIARCSRSTPRSGCAGTSCRTRRFPRKGLTIKDMNEPQRALAHDLLKTGLSARGYLTATSIMELENVLRAIEGGRPHGARPRGLSLLRLRHAGRQAGLGLALRRAPPLASASTSSAAQLTAQLARVLRLESRRGPSSGAAEGHARARRGGGRRPRAARQRSTRRSGRRRSCRSRRPATS